MQANLFAHLAGKLVVDGVAGSGGDDASLDGFADQGQVAHNVEQLVAGTFVGPYQRFVVDVAQLFGIHVGHAHHVGQLVVVLLTHLALVDDDGVVQVAALDEASLQQGLNLAHEDKGTAGSHLSAELRHLFERGILVGDNL